MSVSYIGANHIIDKLRSMSLEVAIYTQTPNGADLGTEVGAGLGYSRQSVTLAAGVTQAGVGVRTSNVNALAFGTATSNWGTVTGYAYLVVGSGDILWAEDLDQPVTVVTGIPFEIQAGKAGLLVSCGIFN